MEQVWTVQADKTDDKLVIRNHDVIADVTEDLGRTLPVTAWEAHLRSSSPTGSSDSR